MAKPMKRKPKRKTAKVAKQPTRAEMQRQLEAITALADAWKASGEVHRDALIATQRHMQELREEMDVRERRARAAGALEMDALRRALRWACQFIALDPNKAADMRSKALQQGFVQVQEALNEQEKKQCSNSEA